MNSLPPPNLYSTSSNRTSPFASRLSQLDLPPLAAVGGVLYPSQVLPHLKPLLESIHLEIQAGKEVIIIKDLTGKSTTGSKAIAERSDLVSFMDSGLRNDPVLRNIQIIKPTFPDNQEFKKLEAQVTDADEVKSSERKYIILMTDCCLEGVCADKLAVETFITKLNRAHVGKIKILTAPEKQEQDIHALWSSHLEKSSIDTLREIFMEATKNPEPHPMSGNYAKLRAPFPVKDDSGLMQSYPEQYPMFMQILQSMLWNPSPMALVLWGKPSTGKSTLLRAAANLIHQTGLGSNYFLIRDGTIRVEGTDGNVGLSYSPNRLLTCIDQIDHASSNVEINMTNQFEQNNPHWKIIATSNLSPEELRNKIGPQFTLVSLQNLDNGKGVSVPNRSPILNFDLDVQNALRLGEHGAQLLKDLARPTTFRQPTTVFLRWEEVQWNVDSELLQLTQYLLPNI